MWGSLRLAPIILLSLIFTASRNYSRHPRANQPPQACEDMQLPMFWLTCTCVYMYVEFLTAVLCEVYKVIVDNMIKHIPYCPAPFCNLLPGKMMGGVTIVWL